MSLISVDGKIVALNSVLYSEIYFKWIFDRIWFEI